MHDHEQYERILAEASPMSLEALRLLGAVLGAPESEAESPRAWASRRLGVPTTSLAAVDHVASATGIAVLGHVLAGEISKHGDAVEIAGPGDGEPPTWSPMVLGTDIELMVPGRLVIHFPAGTIAKAALCLSIDNESYHRELKIYAPSSQRDVAQSLMSQLLARVRSVDNPFRGKVLEAASAAHNLQLSVAPSLTAPRSSLVLPDETWREVDVFIRAATQQRARMRELGLGSTRGLLLTGPPGTGKTHLARVIAAELVGEFTVVFADATSMRELVRELYAESETFGPLVVVLEDIDLIVGHRDHGAHPDSLADFLAALDGARQLEDVFTIATTNDASAIDPAAQRTARFDTILTLPRPGRSEREAILSTYLGPLELDLDLADAVRSLDGCTGSDVREVVRRTVLEHGDIFTSGQLADIASSGRWRPQISTGQYL